MDASPSMTPSEGTPLPHGRVRARRACSLPQSEQRFIEDREEEPEDEEQPRGSEVAQYEAADGPLGRGVPFSAARLLVPRDVPEYHCEGRRDTERQNPERLIDPPQRGEKRCQRKCE